MSARFSFVSEVAAVFAVVCLLGFTLNQGDFAFVDQPLHPFIAVIALLGVQHGVREALVGTGMAIVLYFVGMLHRLGSLSWAEGNHAHILFAFAATGLILGLAQESRNRTRRTLSTQLEERTAEAERLRQRLQVVQAANEKLNERILGEVTTIQSFSEIARRLSVLEEKALYPALCELVIDFLQAHEASVYMMSGPDKLVLAAQQGWGVVPHEAMTLHRGPDLLWGAIDQKRPVTAVDMDAAPRSSDQEDPSRRYRRLICAPIVHPHTGQVMGVVSADRMPFSHFHGNSVSMMGVIAKWAGDSLYNAATFREVANQLAGDDQMPGCVPPILFRDRVQQETSKPGAVSFVCLLIQGYHTMQRHEQVDLRKKIYSVLSPLLDSKMVLGRLNEGLYGVLLPNRDDRAARGFRDTLMHQLRTMKSSDPVAQKATLLAGASELLETDLDLSGLIRCAHQNMVRC